VEIKYDHHQWAGIYDKPKWATLQYNPKVYLKGEATIKLELLDSLAIMIPGGLTQLLELSL